MKTFALSLGLLVAGAPVSADTSSALNRFVLETDSIMEKVFSDNILMESVGSLLARSNSGFEAIGGSISGTGNSVSIRQRGEGNAISFIQSGAGNVARIQQSGQSGSIAFKQVGSGNLVQINQSGH